MRIAYLSYAELPPLKANAIQVVQMCAAFTRAGHEVLLVARENHTVMEGSADEHPDVRSPFGIVMAPRAPIPLLGKLIYAVAASARLKAAGEFDLLYGRHCVSLWWAARGTTPVVYETHRPMQGIDAYFESRLMRSENLVRVVAASRILAEEYRTRFPSLDPGLITVATNAADPLPASTVPPKPVRGRSKALRAGYVGQLYPGKGMPLIVRLASEAPNVDFHVVGGVDPDLTRWREATEGLDNVYMYGQVPHHEALGYAASFDVLLAPYESLSAASRVDHGGRWGSPLKIFEYMAAGKPIVASDLSVLRELIDDGINGILVSPHDVKGWLRALSVLSDPEVRRRLGRAAQKRQLERHMWDRRAVAVLESLSSG